MNNKKQKIELELSSSQLSEIKNICGLLQWTPELFIKNTIEKEISWIKQQIENDSNEFLREYLKHSVINENFQ